MFSHTQKQFHSNLFLKRKAMIFTQNFYNSSIAYTNIWLCNNIGIIMLFIKNQLYYLCPLSIKKEIISCIYKMD